MTRSPVIAAAYMLAVSQGCTLWLDDKAYELTDDLPPRHASHDAERIAKAEAKRARKAAKQMEAKS